MARRGFGGMTALRAALGAVTGITEGLQQRDLLAAQKKREESVFERQKQLDAQNLAMQLAGLQAQGWTSPEALAGQRQEARGAIGSLVGSALQAASGGVPMAGPSKAGMAALQSGMATAPEPTRRITLGGQELALRETPEERQERLAQSQTLFKQTQEAEATRRQNLLIERVKKEGLDSQAAMQLAQENPSAFNALATRANQRQQAQFEERRLGLEGRRVAAAERAAVGAGAGTPAQEIEKRLPVAARNNIADYNAAIRTLQEAVVEVEKNPGAFGIEPTLLAKGGAFGRAIRERREGEKSEDYTKARAQMQSALMKLRKTQFGTQMTKLEQDTGEEVFPSGAESPQRLRQMLDVLVGNAEQLRRGVYEANNAADMYQPIAPARTTAGPQAGGAKTLEQEFPEQAAQIRAARSRGASDAAIRARLKGGQ